jgi:tripartite-type tricarboxylate transporter receptor subunit TctC
MSIKNQSRLALAGVVTLSMVLVGCAATSDDSAVVAQPEASATASEVAVDPCEALSGKQLSFIVTFKPGGGYDTFARLLAPELAEAVGANIVVVNQDGAGGLLAINTLISTGKTDGTEFAIMNGVGTVAAVLAEAEGANFSLDDLSYIGRIGADDAVLVTTANSEYQTFADVLSKGGFTFGSTGPGSSNYVWPSMLMAAFDLESSGSKIISGFKGSGDITLAVLQGDVSGYSATSDSIQKDIDSGEMISLLGLSDAATLASGDSPLAGDLDLTERQKTLINTQVTASRLGRVLVGPADMDSGALQCLRDGLATVMDDDEFLAEAAAAGRAFNYIPGEVVQAEIIDNLRGLPQEYLDALKAAF